MTLTRRQFVRWAGGASLLSAVGCDQLPRLAFIPPDRPELGGGIVPTEAQQDLAWHVLSRVTYGPRPGDLMRVREQGVAEWLEMQLHPENIDDSYCDYQVRRLETLRCPVGELFEYREDFLLRELTRATVLRAVYSERQLFEVMAGFWSDHFNIDSSKGDCPWLKTADDRDVIRKHALGTFPGLLRASALSPAMLWYLDGRANQKTSPDEQPNENYARELLELHTLGVHGGYTQQDVMEIARCLTGWSVRSSELLYKGRVEFHPDRHDDGEKNVLGERIPAGLGERDLDEVLRIVTQHPSTAQYLAAKLCRRFIAEEAPREAIDAVADAYTSTQGDIRTMLRALFATPEFQQAQFAKVKRPFRYLASALRATAAETDGGDALLEYLLRMGHAPFQYPTPDGYPEETAPWLGTMVWRWHFAAALAEGRIAGTRVAWEKVAQAIGGDSAVMAQLLGRAPAPEDERITLASGLGPAFLLATPEFQRY